MPGEFWESTDLNCVSIFMARRLRFIPPGGALAEITCRTFQGCYLLKPSPAVNDLILGVLGRAQRLYPVEVHAFVFMSNHYHLLISVPDAHRMAEFMRYFNSNLARELGRMRGWRDKVWSRRYQAIVVSDEERAQIGRLKYLLSHGVKEGLVEHPAKWKGANTVDALVNGKTSISGRWRDRSREFHAHIATGNNAVFMTEERVALTPLPCWEDHRRKWITSRVAELIETILEEAPKGSPSELPDPAPTQRPSKLKRKPAPYFHCATRKMRRILYEAYLWFVVTYREAAERLRAGELNVEFPSGSFPPALPFVPG